VKKTRTGFVAAGVLLAGCVYDLSRIYDRPRLATGTTSPVRAAS
jgi:hypothetical protein